MKNSHDHRGGGGDGCWFLSRTGVAVIFAVSVLGFLVYTGHSAHLLGVLPYLLILSCPLMHIFMHHGHEAHPSKGQEHRRRYRNDLSAGDTQKSDQQNGQERH